MRRRSAPASATLTALAAVNAFGDVLAEDGSVAAGVWTGEGYARTTDLLLAGELPARAALRENTTLVCLVTDARLDKREAWLVARAGSGRRRPVRRAERHGGRRRPRRLRATGEVPADAFVLSALAPEVIAAAVRDAVASATGAPGCPAAGER